jgi:hypothetical protein
VKLQTKQAANSKRWSVRARDTRGGPPSRFEGESTLKWVERKERERERGFDTKSRDETDETNEAYDGQGEQRKKKRKERKKS